MASMHRWVTAWFTAPSPAAPFTFLYDGRPSAEVLEHWKLTRQSRQLDGRRIEHIVQYSDPGAGLAVRAVAIEYSDFPAVEWVVHIQNASETNSALFDQIEPLDLQLTNPPGGKFVLHYALGDSNHPTNSFAPIDQELISAPSTISDPSAHDEGAGSADKNTGGSTDLTLTPNGGRSSDGYLPFFNLECPTGGMLAAIGWSGQWAARFQTLENHNLRVLAGMQKTHLRLYPGESIRTPRILLVFWDGRNSLRGNNLFRQILLAHYLPRRNGRVVPAPICASVTEVDSDGSYEGPHVRVMPILAARDIEVFWSDMDPQQWYPGGFPNGTGTWEPDLKKYPHGLKPIGDAAHAAGLGYLLWFEPERVAPGTRIDQVHPEWVMKSPGGGSGLFRLQNPRARAWLTDYIDTQISAARLDWVRWDFNIEPLGFWRRNDAPDRQGMTEIRYIEGLYAMWDELRSRHPGLIIDNCASGGRRIDLETCRRSLPLWHSDMQCFGPNPAAEQLQNGGLNRWIPFHGCANFGYEPSYAFRSAMTAGNILVAGNAQGRLSTADPDTAGLVMRTVAAYQRARPFMRGDFYPLFPHQANPEAWYGYQFHRPDLEAGMAIVFRREKCMDESHKIFLKEIDQDTMFDVEFQGDGRRVRLRGSDLSALSVEIPSCPGSIIIYYRKSEG
ncbi:MAG: alpha-galactosidase [Candidatus Omnitrophica bacterium]|nr:alpha-galactosidase [Candidatus Omnitrophota bacterium]